MTIAFRPEKRTAFLDEGTFTVAASQTVRAGVFVKLSATDTAPADANFPQVQECAAHTDIPHAISVSDDPAETFTAAETFAAYLTMGSGVLSVLVGTGGATRDSYAVCVSDGVTNAPAQGNAATRIYSPGRFLATGTAGQHVPLQVGLSVLAKT